MGRYPTRNISFGGLFVESRPMPLYKGGLLDLRLDGGGRSATLRGVVAHQCTAGVDVMLTRHDRRFWQIIFGTLSGGSPTRAPRTTA